MSNSFEFKENSFETTDTINLPDNTNKLETDPWCLVDKVTSSPNDNNPQSDFRDNFTHEMAVKADQNVHDTETEENFQPLDDSKHYLGNLEYKLARFRGQISSQRENESKKLIEALAKSRDVHTNDFVNSTHVKSEEWDSFDELAASTRSFNSVDPKGTLGAVIRKLAPEHVALSDEELLQLLKMDLLSKTHNEILAESPSQDFISE